MAAIELSVVVPCFNEEQSIDRLHDVLTQELEALVDTFEVLLVDDGSSDSTRCAPSTSWTRASATSC